MQDLNDKVEELIISDGKSADNSDMESIHNETIDELTERDNEDQLREKESKARADALQNIKDTYGLTEIPDSTIEQLPADDELTSDIPLDTTYIELIHMKIKSLESLHLENFTQLELINLRCNLIDSLNSLNILKIKKKWKN